MPRYLVERSLSRRDPVSRLARALAMAAMLAAMSLAPLTAVAQTHASDHATSQEAKHPATQRRVTTPQQAAADTAHRRLLAQERSMIPTSGQVAGPMPSAKPSGQTSRVTPALGALALIAGVAVLVVRRANRGQRAGQTA